MLCPKCGTESSSNPRAFGIRRNRGQVACDVPSVHLKCRYLNSREIEVAMFSTILCNDRTKDLCYQTFKSICKWL
jgi:hypothetical protein